MEGVSEDQGYGVGQEQQQDIADLRRREDERTDQIDRIDRITKPIINSNTASLLSWW